jgi:hypothetical protein
MNVRRVLLVVAAVSSIAACHSKKQKPQEFIPPGYYSTRAEAQALANSLNADLAKLKAKEKAEGVPEKSLPCGRYKLVSTRNSDGKKFWAPQLDTTGCKARSPFPPLPTLFPGGNQP